MALALVASAMTVAYLGGIAARSERYMRDHWAHAKGFNDAKTLLASAKQEEADHVAAQKAAGLDLLAPALVRWEDLFRPFEKEGSGVTTGQVFRYFETNTFFRQPDINGGFAKADPTKLFETFAIPKGTGWVLTLPSPWDFVCRAKDAHKGAKASQRILEVAEALNPVVKAAFKQGAKLVRFHDPSIAYRRAASRDLQSFAVGLAIAARGHEADCTLHITNGDPFDLPEALNANPLGGLSIEDPGRAPPKGLKLSSKTKLSLALVRGEDSVVENPRAVAERAQELSGALGLDLWGLTNGWDLDHVPHAIAQRKIAALGQARLAVKEVTA